MKVIGVDYGEARTGVAVSDATGVLARGIETIFSKDMVKTAEQVARHAENEGAELIVVGLPKNMDGSMGFRAEATMRFAEVLGGLINIEIKMRDERLTTVSATRILDEVNVRGMARKNIIDKMSATVILQEYLDSVLRP